MTFRITGLPPERFRHLFGLPDEELARHGAVRVVADAKPGYPDRVALRDAEIGERLLLLNYTHQPADNPYRASHAIFVLEGAEEAYDQVGTVPEVIRSRSISLRAFDEQDLMIDADLVQGVDLEAAIGRLLADARVAYLHAHYAKRGCYAARVDRA
jgi:hypothetical protein